MFANGPGDLGSIPGRVIPKTQKMVLDASLFNTQHYKVRIKVKWSNPGKGVAPSPTPWCSKLSKREPSGHPRLWLPTLLLLYIYIYIYVHSCLHTIINRNIGRERDGERQRGRKIIWKNTHLFTWAGVQFHMHIYPHAHTHIHIYVRECIYIYIYIYICLCVCV